MLYFAEVFLNYFGGKIKSNSRVLAIFGMGILAFYAGTMRSDYSYDTLSYESFYNQVNFGVSGVYNVNRFEIGFRFLNLLGGKLGLDYQTFRLVTFSLFFLIFLITLIRLQVNLSSFVAVYSIVPFFSDVTQVRNFFMLVLVLLAFSVLNKKKVSSYLLATILIIIGASIHSMGFLFLLGLLFTRFSIVTLKKLILYFSMVITPSFIFLKLVDPTVLIKIVDFFISQSGRGVVDIAAFTSGISIVDFFKYFVLVQLMIIYFYWKIKVKVVNKEMQCKLVSLFLVEILTFPFVVFSSGSFSRMIRAGFLTLLILNYSKRVDDFPKAHDIKVGNILFFVIFIMAIFTFDDGIVGNSQFAEYIPYILHLR